MTVMEISHCLLSRPKVKVRVVALRGKSWFTDAQTPSAEFVRWSLNGLPSRVGWLSGTRCLVLDEPTSALTLRYSLAVMQDLAKSGK